jgi:polar amino acid transport system substrate-binding protein
MLTPTAHAEEVWKITSLDWQPYSGGDMATQGNAIQKLRELLKREGITLQVDFFPWARAKDAAKSTEYIGFFPAWPEEVDKGFVASPTVSQSEIGVIKAKNTPIAFKDVEQLFKNYSVGLVRTYVYPQDITEAAAKYPGHVDYAMSEDTLLQKLAGGRHPVAITDPSVMLYLAGKRGIDNIEVVKVLTKKDLVIALRLDAENKNRIYKLQNILAKQRR